MLEASLEDLEGRFNLNLLVNKDGTPNPPAVAAFQRLLQILQIEPKWAGYIVDWIDYDITPTNPDGAEDSVYMGQSPPYRTANAYITSASDLLALPGFGHDRYAKLAPYVVALPINDTHINVCTASGPVLDAFLGGKLEFSSDAETLAKNRASAGGCFPKLADYKASFDGTAFAQASSLLGQDSIYFRLTSFVTIGSAEFNLYSLLLQDSGTGNARAILRSYTPD
jgi:general secretion pathway protein K